MKKVEKAKAGTRSGLGDRIFRIIAVTMAAFIIIIMLGILYELIQDSGLSMKKFGFGFFTSSEWNPVTENFGALSSIFGTVISTVVAMLIAVPLSLLISLFLVELAPPALSKPAAVAIELLAAVPSIIYGMWGLFVFAPYMADHVQPFLNEKLGFIPLFQGPPIGIGMLSAGIILALMILPFISSVMRDVFKMVPPVLKESAYGMGSTTWEVTKKVTVSYGVRGLIGACFLGLGRAIGETMAVTFVIGNKHSLSLSLFDPGNTIASTLANEFAEASEPMYLSSLIYLGLTLFIMTLIVQVFAQLWLKRVHKRMGAL